MKFKLSIIILVLLSFFNIGAFSDEQRKINSFNDLEYIYVDKSEFVENGSKIQYKTKSCINNELDRIFQYFNKTSIYNYEYIAQNKIKLSDKDTQINIDLWNDDIYTYVTITLVDNNGYYKTKDLLSILKELITKNCEEVQYYRYYKGKVASNYENEYINNISSCIYDPQILNLSNGYTGSGYCTNGEKINFTISNYDTGAYIIIGTPIIFTTY